MKPIQLLGTACFVAALLTSSSLFAQVKVGTNPTTIESTSNLEVEASTSGRKVKVNKTTGQLTIADGTQGADKVLTSDANGNARWNTTEEAKIPKTMFIGFQANNEDLDVTASTTGAINSRFKVVPLAGYESGYSAARRAYLIPEAGYYRVEVGTRCTFVGTGAIILMLAGKLGVSDKYNHDEGTGNSVAKSFVHTQYYPAGAEAYGHLWDVSSSVTSTKLSNSYMTVTRLAL